ncbi:MAG: hypothetical protein IPN19_02320 [Elusimicrobia bacterium]|nr:hypothetical protein [Elusimicrobiota bacterium]
MRRTDESFNGFHAGEGEYFLSVAGTALVTQPSGNMGLMIVNNVLVYETTTRSVST